MKILNYLINLKKSVKHGFCKNSGQGRKIAPAFPTYVLPALVFFDIQHIQVLQR
jgi:hypothetical protein